MDSYLDKTGKLTDDAAPVRAGFIGCGSHAFRSLYPALQYLPVDLVATCDLVPEKAAAFAEQFGADTSYTDFHELLAEEDLDCVFVAINYDDEGRPQYLPFVTAALEAGCDVWIEKPPAASVATVKEMQAVERETGGFVQVGYKKCFALTTQKATELVEREEFGELNSLHMRYPLTLPEYPESGEPVEHDRSLANLLDVVHPGSLLCHLAGDVARVDVERAGAGDGLVTLVFESGAVGSIHMAGNGGWNGDIERVEVTGEGASLLIENGANLTYNRPGGRGEGDDGYGETTTFTSPIEEAPVSWKPEFSLSQLYNKGMFIQGFYHELEHFLECVREDERPATADLHMSRQLVGVYEAILAGGGTVR